jgi:hypothetical protein
MPYGILSGPHSAAHLSFDRLPELADIVNVNILRSCGVWAPQIVIPHEHYCHIADQPNRLHLKRVETVLDH